MDSIQSFASAIYHTLTALIVSLATTITEFVRRFIGPKTVQESEPAPEPESAPRPTQQPSEPAIHTPPNSLEKDLQLKLAHRHGAMAQYTRPKYEAREW